MTGAMVPAVWTVTRTRRETRDTMSLELVPAEGAAAYDFTPGQFNMLYAFGIGEAPISLSGDPAAVPRLTHTVRSVGAVSRALTRLQKGAAVGLRGPFGSHWPVAQGTGGDVIVVAGGLGLAPLRPALYQLAAQRKQFNRITLIYGGRTPADLLYLRELDQWHRRCDFDVQVTVDSAGGEWRGHVGVVTPLVARAQFTAPGALALVCGPEIMMRFVARDLRERGVASERIFVSMERNMQCAVGWCGRCQLGANFVCKDGPVFPYARIAHWLSTPEI